MKNRNFAIIICIILLLGSACTKDNNDLFNEFGLNKDQLSTITTISAHKAIAIDCSFEQFMKIRQELKNNGFYEWNEFHGILGVDDIIIFDIVSRPLLYSFKFVEGRKVKYDIYSPVAVYDKQNRKLYLVMASDFGG